MNISEKGLDLILSFEGKLKPTGDGRYKAYRCPAGVPTIYAGCTEGVHDGMIVTEDEGREMFRREIEKHERIVERLVSVDMTQAQFDSLVSFSFNCGGLKGSTLLKKLNKGDYHGAADCFRDWTKAVDPKTGKRVVLNGLVRRRKAEAAMFVSDLPGADDMPQAATQTTPMSTGQKVAAGATAGGTVIGVAKEAMEAVKPASAPQAKLDPKAVIAKAQEVKAMTEDAKGLATYGVEAVKWARGDGMYPSLLAAAAFALFMLYTRFLRRST